MKQKFQRTQFFMVVGFVFLLTSFFSCNLEKDKKTDEEIKNKAIAITRARAGIAEAEDVISAGKTAVRTANEKNTKAKEVKVEEAKLISETLIKSVSDKVEALKVAKNNLANFNALNAEQIKTQTASLKLARIELEAETSKLRGKIASLDAEMMNSPVAKARAEIAEAEKVISAGKTAVQTANEKNTKAKEVKVEEAKLISETLIKSVSDKIEALKTAKNTLANFNALNAEQIKTQTASLKQARIELEAETAKLKGTFDSLDAEIANPPVVKAKAEIVDAEKAISVGKTAVQTANEKNTKAKEVKVEEAKLISEALIKSVSDKIEALKTAKVDLENIASLTPEEVKTKTASLKQARIELEAETAKLKGTFDSLDAEIANPPVAKARAEILDAEKAISAGKTAVQTANEKNIRAKEVKVEEAKLISETLIKSVSDKTETLKTAKVDLENIASLTPEEVKTKTASLKQARIELEAETAKLKGTFASLDAEIAEKEPAMPVLQGQDEKGNPIVVSTKDGKSISHEDLVKFKNNEENKNKVLNTEKINVTFNVITPSKLTEFFENFTHLNIDISNETEFISSDTQELGTDGKVQYFQASKLVEVMEKINFVENQSGGVSQQSLYKGRNALKFEKIKGNIIISDTFSPFSSYDTDRELEAFATGNYYNYDGTPIPRTRTWITFSKLTKLIHWLKKFDFFNNKVRFGDMLVVRSGEGDKDVLDCVDTIIEENIERFELKNTAGEDKSIKFAGLESIRCYMILREYEPYPEITIKQLLQFSKRCRWKMLCREDDGTVLPGGFDAMALRFKIKNLNCKKLSKDDLKDLTFERAWFGGRFEGEDTDLSEISFRNAVSNGGDVASFTGILPKNNYQARYSNLIIHDAEILDIDESEVPNDSYYPKDYFELIAGTWRLPYSVHNLSIHNLKGLDKITRGLSKKEIWKKCYPVFTREYSFPEPIKIDDQYVGSEEAYKELVKLCAFRKHGSWANVDNYKRFVCFTDGNNNVIKGPYIRESDEMKKIGDHDWEILEEDGALIPVPLNDYKQDEDGFFEKK